VPKLNKKKRFRAWQYKKFTIKRGSFVRSLCIKLYNSLRIRFVRASPYRQTRDTGSELGWHPRRRAKRMVHRSCLSLDIRRHRASCACGVYGKRGRSSFKILQMNTIRNQCRPLNISGNDDPFGDLLTGSPQCLQVCVRVYASLRYKRWLLQDVFRIWRHTRLESCVIEIQMSKPCVEPQNVAANIARQIPYFAIRKRIRPSGDIFESHLRELLKVHQCCTNIIKRGMSHHYFIVLYRKPILSRPNDVVKI